jgi:hypothetical protein
MNLQKYVPEMVDGKESGKFLKKEMTFYETLNPTVPANTEGTLIRMGVAALVTALLRG